MSRFTPSDLKSQVAIYSRYQIESGSIYYYKEGGRNGYQAVDLHRINANGSHSMVSNVECGSSRECFAAMQLHHAGHGGYINPQKKGTITRAQALEAVKIAGVDLTVDFFTLDHWDVDLLVVWAKLSKYRRPSGANGSAARYFFANLQKLNRRK